MRLDGFADTFLHTLQLPREGFHVPAYLLVGYPGVYLRGLNVGVPQNTADRFDGYAV